VRGCARMLRPTAVLTLEAAADTRTRRTSVKVLDEQQTGVGAVGVSVQDGAAVG